MTIYQIIAGAIVVVILFWLFAPGISGVVRDDWTGFDK